MFLMNSGTRARSGWALIPRETLSSQGCRENGRGARRLARFFADAVRRSVARRDACEDAEIPVRRHRDCRHGCEDAGSLIGLARGFRDAAPGSGGIPRSARNDGSRNWTAPSREDGLAGRRVAKSFAGVLQWNAHENAENRVDSDRDCRGAAPGSGGIPRSTWDDASEVRRTNGESPFQPGPAVLAKAVPCVIAVGLPELGPVAKFVQRLAAQRPVLLERWNFPPLLRPA